MSQAGIEPNMKTVFGSQNKTRYESYSDEELASDEFFWNQLEVIVAMKNMEYFRHFMCSLNDYIDRKSGI